MFQRMPLERSEEYPDLPREEVLQGRGVDPSGTGIYPAAAGIHGKHPFGGTAEKSAEGKVVSGGGHGPAGGDGLPGTDSSNPPKVETTEPSAVTTVPTAAPDGIHGAGPNGTAHDPAPKYGTVRLVVTGSYIDGTREAVLLDSTFPGGDVCRPDIATAGGPARI